MMNGYGNVEFSKHDFLNQDSTLLHRISLVRTFPVLFRKGYDRFRRSVVVKLRITLAQ